VEGFRITTLLEDYPNEITIENWEEFVYAPTEVINHFSKKELEELKLPKTAEAEDGSYRDLVLGRVFAFNKAVGWWGMPGVEMSNPCWTVTTDLSGTYFTDNVCSQVCATYNHLNNFPLNGVTTLDLLLVQRHILNITPFTEARQMIAADVDRDGRISNLDIREMRKLILGVLADWTVSQNLIFLPDFEYQDADSLMPDNLEGFALETYGIYPNCSTTFDTNRRVIKTGDVNGTFSF